MERPLLKKATASYNLSKDGTMEKIKYWLQEHWAAIMAWYDGLEPLYQYGVLFLLIIAVILLFSFYSLRKVTR